MQDGHREPRPADVSRIPRQPYMHAPVYQEKTLLPQRALDAFPQPSPAEKTRPILSRVIPDSQGPGEEVHTHSARASLQRRPNRKKREAPSPNGTGAARGAPESNQGMGKGTIRLCSDLRPQSLPF